MVGDVCWDDDGLRIDVSQVTQEEGAEDRWEKSLRFIKEKNKKNSTENR